MTDCPGPIKLARPVEFFLRRDCKYPDAQNNRFPSPATNHSIIILRLWHGKLIKPFLIKRQVIFESISLVCGGI